MSTLLHLLAGAIALVATPITVEALLFLGWLGLLWAVALTAIRSVQETSS